MIFLECAMRPVRTAHDGNIVVYDQYLAMGNTVGTVIIHRDAIFLSSSYASSLFLSVFSPFSLFPKT